MINQFDVAYQVEQREASKTVEVDPEHQMPLISVWPANVAERRVNPNAFVLPNLGNSCWLNAGLQAMVGSAP